MKAILKFCTTNNLPFQRQTCYHLIDWTVHSKVLFDIPNYLVLNPKNVEIFFSKMKRRMKKKKKLYRQTPSNRLRMAVIKTCELLLRIQIKFHIHYSFSSWNIKLTSCSVRRILKRGWLVTSENLRSTKLESCFTQNQSDFLPKIRWRPKKKGLHSNLVRFFTQNLVQAKTKVFAYHLCVQSFCPTYEGRGHAAILRTILY